MFFLYTLLLFFLGLAVGSFIGAYTYRVPKKISIRKGRSFCPNCKKNISWFDNIPLLSFLILGGKCRNCGKKISFREPAIEVSSGVGFSGVFLAMSSCSFTLAGSPICKLNEVAGLFALPLALIIISALIAIFVTDFENQLIPDKPVFLLLFLVTLVLLLSSSSTLILRIFSGFFAAALLLVIHLLTRGRGMGLGDVKLSLAAGVILSWPETLVYLHLSFLIGAVTGLMLIALGKARFGKQIAFGPFLIISLIITLFWGNILSNLLFLRFL